MIIEKLLKYFKLENKALFNSLMEFFSFFVCICVGLNVII